MGWPEAIVEVMHLLPVMPRWMSGSLLLTLLLLAIGYVVGKFKDK